MRSAVGIYDTHEKAVAAIKQLQAAGYPVNQLTIMGQGQIVEGEARIKSVSTIAVKEISIGATIGSILGNCHTWAGIYSWCRRSFRWVRGV